MVARLQGVCGPSTLQLEHDDGSSLSVTETPAGSLVCWVATDGTSSHGVGSGSPTALVSFDYMGHYSEVRMSDLVPAETGRRAAHAFLESGRPDVDGFVLEPD